MAYFIIGWVILWISSGGIGVAVLNWLGDPTSFRIGDRIILAEWIGVMLLSIVLLFVSLVLPLSPWTGIAVTACLLGGALLPSQNRQTIWSLTQHSLSIGRLRWVQCILLIGGWAIAAAMTQQVTWIDTGLYHAGTIQWLSKFGTVPGVALIHDRFSFTSSWFALAAPFNPNHIDFRAVAITNSFLMLLSGIHLVIVFRHIAQQRSILADWFVSIFYIFVFLALIGIDLIAGIMVSPSPDAVILLLAGITGWFSQVLLTPSAYSPSGYSRNPKAIQTQFAPVLVMLGVSAIAIKLSGIPILAVVLLFYAQIVNRQMRSWFQAVLIMIVGLLPVALFIHLTPSALTSPGQSLTRSQIRKWLISKAGCTGLESRRPEHLTFRGY